jgi:hypothetical protein
MKKLLFILLLLVFESAVAADDVLYLSCLINNYNEPFFYQINKKENYAMQSIWSGRAKQAELVVSEFHYKITFSDDTPFRNQTIINRASKKFTFEHGRFPFTQDYSGNLYLPGTCKLISDNLL